MKNRIALTLFLAILISLSYAQKVEIIKLKPNEKDFLFSEISISEVIDQRHDKEFIGVVQKGLGNKKWPANFSKNLDLEIKDFLDAVLKQPGKQRHLTLVVHKLWVSEKTTMTSEKGILELSLEFKETDSTGIHSLGIFDKRIEKGPMDATKGHGKRIKEGILECIQDLIDGKATIDEGTTRLSFTKGIPLELKQGFFNSYNDLVYNKVIEGNPKIKKKKIDKNVDHYSIRNAKKKRHKEYAYFDGENIYVNSYLISTSATYYLKPETRGRYLAFVDRYARPGSAAAFGLIGAAASTKTRASVLDLEKGTFLECDETVMIVLLEPYQDLYEVYRLSKQNFKDQVEIIQKLNERLLEEGD